MRAKVQMKARAEAHRAPPIAVPTRFCWQQREGNYGRNSGASVGIANGMQQKSRAGTLDGGDRNVLGRDRKAPKTEM